jgi:protein-disulfide isomerase
VDIAQLVSKEGFSPVAVKKSTILETGGKTWVAYTDPKVNVQVLTDTTCEKCAPDEALVWLHRILPTMEATPVTVDSAEGKALVEKLGITTLPAFVFGNEVSKTDLFGLAKQIFEEKDGGRYLLNTVQLGIQPGKYLKLPRVGENDIQIGPKDAKVKVVEYSDFQCPYCRSFHPSVKKMLSEQKDVLYVYKHLPLPFHPQANNASNAAECANEQGKFTQYADALFGRQDEWGKTQGTQKFKDYARQLGLKADQFNACLDSQKYADRIKENADEAASFGVNGTPGTFVNDTFIGGAVSYDELKKTIDAQLAK